MTDYKIKIACTSLDELCYDNKIINKKNYNKCKLEELINNYDNINKLLILYKKMNNKNITTKTLEFGCNNEISEINFLNFIQDMKNIGFNSKQDTSIHFIYTQTNESIYKYKFQSIEPIYKFKINKKKNRSNYNTQILYTK